MRNFLQGSRWQVPGTNGGDAAAHLNRASNFNHAEGIYGWTSRILTAGRTRRSPSFLRRSEEHTSELQSLMRISYAVFCLKQKKDRPNSQTPSTPSSYHNTHYIVDTQTKE